MASASTKPRICASAWPRRRRLLAERGGRSSFGEAKQQQELGSKRRHRSDAGRSKMRRVVVTGMGIVSSIGNNTQEVARLAAGSAIRHRQGGQIRRTRFSLPGAWHADARCRARWSTAAPCASIGRGTAWNHVAMDQAIADSGLATDEVSNERTGIIMGSGGPSAEDHRRLRRHRPAPRAPSASAPSPCRKPCPRPLRRRSPCGSRSRASTIRSPRPARRRTIASATPMSMIQCGKQDIMFAGGCEELEWDPLGAVRRHGRHVLRLQ